MKRLLIIIMFSITMTGCFTESIAGTVEANNVNTSNITQERITPVSETFEVTATATMSNSTPLAISVVTPTITPSVEATATATASIVNANELQETCGFKVENIEGSYLTEGLILSGQSREEQGQIVLGSKGLEDPFLVLPSNDLSGVVSPNGSWVAFFSFLEVVDQEKDIYSVEITVTDFLNQEEYKVVYENISLSRQRYWYWANNASIVVPLREEGDLFQWLVWNPFINEQRVISIQLVDIGGNLPENEQIPYLDPLLKLVIYPCVQCSDAEYQIRELTSGNVHGTIELNAHSTATARSQPIFSPDGEYIAIGVGSSLTEDHGKIIIFDRVGQEIHEIELPNRNGVTGGGILSWSPNSQYLAFYRNDPAFGGTLGPSLSVFDLVSGSTKNLCLKGPALPIWAQDSSRIAVNLPRNNIEEQVDEIFIIDTSLDKYVQLNTPIFYRVVGWTEIGNSR